jgi:uncharacterized protein YbjT (DUF2867 family)
MADDPILVLGATGTVGRRLVPLLRAAGHPVRAASRSGGTRFDWADRSSWEPAVDGASRLYLLAPDGVPVEEDLVALAVAFGVDRIVLQSSAGIEAMGDERLILAEKVVRGSGAQWTILRPHWFDQNFDEGLFREAVRAGSLAVPVGTTRQSFVDAGDIAAVAAATLTGPGHAAASYEVTGPRALTFAEAVDVVARAAGRPVAFDGTVEGYLAAQEALGRPRAEAEAEARAFTALAALGDAQPTAVVRDLTGRDPKPFEAYAAQAAATPAWRDTEDAADG